MHPNVCHNPNFGFATKVRVCKGAGQDWTWESHFMLSKVQKSVRKWTLTLPNELPFLELESQWTPESLESNCRGQNSLDWKVPYIIGKFLERRCLKWACMTHLDTWNTSYGQKKGHESNWKHKLWPKEGLGVKLPIWLPTIKSQESPRFPCFQVACHISLESSWRGLQFFFHTSSQL